MSAIANAKPTVAASNDSKKVITTDVLIIGAGLAGLSSALSLPKSLNITILSKAELQACSSHYAQGGIAASLDKSDSVADHVADTLVAGAGLCALDNTTSILSAGQQAVQWLCEQGVPFTSVSQILASAEISPTTIATKTVLTTADLHLTKEGGHGCRRVAHADDATGRHVMDALIIQAQKASNITILPFCEALSLLTLASEQTSKDKRCRGAIAFDHDKQQLLTIHSAAVVMASGGLGQLFARASAPNVCVGDGLMMAWQAGCRLANLEFVQFHPTGLALAESSFLISEALRGEGGRLYCPLSGKRFMLELDERAELAPRDIVARAIAEQITNNGLGYVHLDVSHLPASFLREHFPQIYQTLLALGIDITSDPIPVAPTAHYSCGGIVTCAQGLSDVRGLYAAGEVAYTGLHGANRLASNSLLECIVVGRNIAKHLPHYLVDDSWRAPTVANPQTICLAKNKTFNVTANSVTANITTNGTVYASEPLLATTTDLNNEDINNNDSDDITSSLKTLMSSHLGIVRHAKQLKQALGQIEQWQQTIQAFEISETLKILETLKTLETLSLDHNDNAQNQHAAETLITAQSLKLFKLQRQLQLATLIVQSALQRHESRGGHYRLDFPKLTDVALASVIEPPSDNKPIAGESNYNHEYLHIRKLTQASHESLRTLATI